jgi:hypothetical protein
MRATMKFAVICVSLLIAAHADAVDQRNQMNALDFQERGARLRLELERAYQDLRHTGGFKSAGNDVSSIVEKYVPVGSAKDKEHAMSSKLNTAIAVAGIDIGKNSFHVIGLDKRGAIVLRQKWSRGQVEARLANTPPCLIGMEACVGAHHLSRKLQALVRLGGESPCFGPVRATPAITADNGKVRLGGESPSFGPIRASVR